MNGLPSLQNNVGPTPTKVQQMRNAKVISPRRSKCDFCSLFDPHLTSDCIFGKDGALVCSNCKRRGLPCCTFTTGMPNYVDRNSITERWRLYLEMRRYFMIDISADEEAKVIRDLGTFEMMLLEDSVVEMKAQRLMRRLTLRTGISRSLWTIEGIFVFLKDDRFRAK